MQVLLIDLSRMDRHQMTVSSAKYMSRDCQYLAQNQHGHPHLWFVQYDPELKGSLRPNGAGFMTLHPRCLSHMRYEHIGVFFSDVSF